jgi:hypothetical protein
LNFTDIIIGHLIFALHYSVLFTQSVILCFLLYITQLVVQFYYLKLHVMVVAFIRALA